MNKETYILQAGQTLIETLVAALVLVMGVTAAVSLALYGLSSSEDITKQMISVGLAREGMEAIKNMRDTNWLYTTLSNDCFDFYTTQPPTDVASCYKDWNKGIRGGTYVLGLHVDPSALDKPDYWELTPSTEYRLSYKLNDSVFEQGFYFPPPPGEEGNSDYSRKITLTEENFTPFNHTDLGPRLKVRVDVWWNSEHCQAGANPPTNTGCKVSLETYLTNWKNY